MLRVRTPQSTRRLAWLALLLGAVSLHVTASDVAPDRAEAVRPLLPGSALPDAVVRTVEGSETTLVELTRGTPAVLVFYRGGWCPYCTLQLSQLGAIEPTLVELGYRVIALSPDRPAVLAEGAAETPATRTLVSDSSAAAARALGIAFRVDAATVEQYQGYGIDLAAASGYDHHLLPVPAVFIVDASGIIQFGYAHPDYRYRIPGELILAAAGSLLDLKPLR